METSQASAPATTTAHGASAATLHDTPALSTAMIVAMAVASGVAVANIYYNQPMLEVMSRDMHGNRAIDQVSMVTQLGYAAGLVLLVPLGDFINRKRLIVAQFLVVALAAVWIALSGGPTGLLMASLVIGLCSTVAQQIIPFAVHLAPPAKRGHVLGMVMAGLLCGILLSRTLAGFVATHAGWREMFWLCVPLAIACAALMAWVLPSTPSSAAAMSYPKLLASLKDLWVELPPLRLAAVTQALMFGSFSAFWTTLAFRLAAPPFGMNASIAGLFGVIGAVGVFAAPIAGRLSDRIGARAIVLLTVSAAALSWLAFGFWNTIPGLIVGVTLLDFGVQGTLVANQSIIYKLRPEARSRVNTLFMGTTFIGGAIGSALSAVLWRFSGNMALTTFGLLFAGGALVLQLNKRT